MLTVFSIPKPFEGHIGTIQRNAIESWTMLRPKPEIILFGYEPGIEAVAGELDTLHISEVARNQFGTPMVRDLFTKAQEKASNDILCYVNADIILMSDFMAAVKAVCEQPEFLMVSRRWNIDVDRRLDFELPNWEADLKKRIQEDKPQAVYAIDYFLFTKYLYKEIPDLAIGRMAWDNWLVYHARMSGAPVIDATEVVTILHQNHIYDHLRAKSVIDVHKNPEVKQNTKIAGGAEHYFSISSANWKLTEKGLMKPGLKDYCSARRIKTFVIMHPHLNFFFKPLWRLYDEVHSWGLSLRRS
ncbi:MAG: hypothetical protein MUO75_06195 [Actinobacteria bacterium]|nr:hypothetical protein [Actinomycetota bacterium]